MTKRIRIRAWTVQAAITKGMALRKQGWRVVKPITIGWLCVYCDMERNDG